MLALPRYPIIIVSGGCSAISLISDSLPECDSPELTSWIGLSIADETTLVCGKWLSANHISAANRLLRAQFPSQNGLQDTCVLQQKGTWSDGFVQIIFISHGHWACISNKYSSLGIVALFDSLHTVPSEDGSIVQQVCSILRSNEPAITINVIMLEFKLAPMTVGYLRLQWLMICVLE